MIRTALGVLGALLFVVVFNGVAISLFFVLTPPLALLWVAALATVFLAWHMGTDWRRRTRRWRVRMRPPQGDPQWVGLAIVASLLLAFGVNALIQYAAPVDAEEASPLVEFLMEYQRTPLGWVALVALVAGLVPIVEEFCFRGYIQHSLERQLGPPGAIAIAALLFTAAHIGGPHWSLLLIPLTLGLVTGLATYRFESIWVAVPIHSAWNFAMAVASRLYDDEGSAAATAAEANPATPAAPPDTLLIGGLSLIAVALWGWATILRRHQPRPRTARPLGPREP